MAGGNPVFGRRIRAGARSKPAPATVDGAVPRARAGGGGPIRTDRPVPAPGTHRGPAVSRAPLGCVNE